MLGAMKAVEAGEMGRNRAALEFGVPPSTLKDRLTGRVKHGTKPGPTPYLNPEEEKELVEFLLNCSKMGYGKTRGQVLKTVEVIAKEKEMKFEGSVTDGWWRRFLKRWPNLALRKGDPFSHARIQMTSRDVFEKYFDLLKDTLQKHLLFDKPSQVYNCDESGMPFEHKMPRTIAEKGVKKVRQHSSGNKTQVSVLACVNATGQAIPPMVIFAGKNFNHDLADGEVPGTLYGMSDSGWMDQELFANWFSSHFLRHAVSSRPLLLILDGHTSHYTLDLVQSALEHGVVLFLLPPHTTADSQPLDISCFGPLKTYWVEACREYMFANVGRVITKFQFSQLFAKAWSNGMTISNIVSGFRKTGIYPFNPQAVLECIETSSNQDLPGEAGQSVESLVSQFSEAQTMLFTERYKNGYNIYTDTEYVAWLQEFHPESTPSLTEIFSDIRAHTTLQNDGASITPDNCLSSAEHLLTSLTPSDRPLTPLAPSNHQITPSDRPLTPLTPSNHQLTPSDRPLTPSNHQLTPSDRPLTPSNHQLTPSNRSLTPLAPSNHQLTPSDRSLTPLAPSNHQLTPSDRPVTPLAPSNHQLTPSHCPVTPLAPSNHQLTPSISTTGKVGASVSSSTTAVHSKLKNVLTYPVCQTPTGRRKNRCVSGARILTSAESLTFL